MEIGEHKQVGYIFSNQAAIEFNLKAEFFKQKKLYKRN